MVSLDQMSDLEITFRIYFMCMNVLPACMYMYHVIPVEARRGPLIGFPGTGVKNGCEPPCGFWKLNLGSVREQ